MEKQNISETEFQLRKLLGKYSDIFVYHQWPSEHKRWVELVFALVARISNKSEDEIRDVIEELDDPRLDLLDVEALSEIPETDGGIDLDYPHARRVVEYLSESGFTEEESKSSVLVMHEAAKSLIEYHDGKIQKYLRKYGQQMIDELSQNFSFSKMSEADVKYAFTYWLQNVLNMPISLEDENVKKFCKKINKKPEELCEVADKLNINIALLDDFIERYIRDLEERKLK